MSSSLGQRGKWAERQVQAYLERLNQRYARFDFERLPDARAARGALKAQAADFAFFCPARHGLIEVKELDKGFRLPVSRLTQAPRLRKRELAGGLCAVLTYHHADKSWRAAFIGELEVKASGSWDMAQFHGSADLEEVLGLARMLVECA